MIAFAMKVTMSDQLRDGLPKMVLAEWNQPIETFLDRVDEASA